MSNLERHVEHIHLLDLDNIPETNEPIYQRKVKTKDVIKEAPKENLDVIITKTSKKLTKQELLKKNIRDCEKEIKENTENEWFTDKLKKKLKELRESLINEECIQQLIQMSGNSYEKTRKDYLELCERNKKCQQ
jgi:putative lipase involved disintegration of autophagic bodies